MKYSDEVVDAWRSQKMIGLLKRWEREFEESFGEKDFTQYAIWITEKRKNHLIEAFGFGVGEEIHAGILEVILERFI